MSFSSSIHDKYIVLKIFSKQKKSIRIRKILFVMRKINDAVGGNTRTLLYASLVYVPPATLDTFMIKDITMRAGIIT